MKKGARKQACCEFETPSCEAEGQKLTFYSLSFKKKNFFKIKKNLSLK